MLILFICLLIVKLWFPFHMDYFPFDNMYLCVHKSLNKSASLFKLINFLILMSCPSITIFQILSSKFFLPYSIRHILQ